MSNPQSVTAATVVTAIVVLVSTLTVSINTSITVTLWPGEMQTLIFRQ